MTSTGLPRPSEPATMQWCRQCLDVVSRRKTWDVRSLHQTQLRRSLNVVELIGIVARMFKKEEKRYLPPHTILLSLCSQDFNQKFRVQVRIQNAANQHPSTKKHEASKKSEKSSNISLNDRWSPCDSCDNLRRQPVWDLSLCTNLMEAQRLKSPHSQRHI
ncbi:hypothetical protein RRG08_005017 [Elysia crispata]|uniref:Uncharacterized protein n=1 Tax=Elysia crispata TaxID=231223 RepID=A0AAE1B463_9GAST|nr:hypothetical protein RRG08_005017 [Elysia crispata]